MGESRMEEKLTKVAESQWLTALNRILTPILLALMAFLGTQVWNDIRGIATDVVGIRIAQGVVDQKLTDHERRIDKLETYGGKQ